MKGYAIGGLDGGQPARKTSPSHKLKVALRGLGTVMAPEDAEEPILAPLARAALFEWLTEMNSVDALLAVKLKPRTTALLSGPPGCGKTTLVHHLAARLGFPMVLVGAENLIGMYLGESGKNVARLFDTLADCDVPCVVFLDEIEAIGGSRDKHKGGGADNERTATLTVLLRRMEQFSGMMVAATNRPADLDTALWRRFGLHVAVDLPGEDERFAILRRYGLPLQFANDDLELLCSATDGASPALLRGLMEGIKRQLVLGPKMGRDVSDPVAVIAQVVSAIKPPPELDPAPTLWTGRAAIRDSLDGMTWPPTMGEA